MSKAHTRQKACSRFAIGPGVLTTVALLFLLVAFVGNGASTSALAQGQPAKPFNVITLGDSIMWGQGLPEQMKFRTLVANWLQSQYGSSRNVVQWFTHAHSGAVTGWGMYPAETKGGDPDTWYLTNPPAAEHMALGGLSSGDIYPGEVPFGYLSISAQIGMTVNELKGRIDPADVDLVLLDGGINDVSVAAILDVTSTEHGNGPLWVRHRAEALCVNHMKSLLPQVLNQFPNAVVVVTGYFPMVSASSDLNEVAKFLEMHLHVNSPNLTGPSGGDALAYIDGVRAASLSISIPIRAAMADRSQAWSQTAFSGLTDLVNQSNQGLTTPRVALAWPSFSDDNAYAAPNTFLFTLGEFLADEKLGAARKSPPGDWSTPQGVAYYRAQNCTQYDMWDPLCYDAMLGHPNPKGAQAYADAIISRLGVFAAKLGLPQPKPLFTRLSTGTDTQGPYVSIANGPYQTQYWTQVPTWFQVNAVDSSNNQVQANVTIEPIAPRYWDGTQWLEAAAFGVLPGEYVPTSLQQTGIKFYYMCLPGGDPISLPNGQPYPVGAFSASTLRPANLTAFPGNQQGCSLLVSAPGYITCIMQLGQVSQASGGVFSGLGATHVPGPGGFQPCPAAPTIGGVVAAVPNNTVAGKLSTQHLQIQLPALAAKVCPSVDGKTCNSNTATPQNAPWDIVTVTSGGVPVGDANVSTGVQSLAVTSTNGVAVITRLCYPPGSQVAQIGQTTAPVRTPRPCGQRTATVSMSGYQSTSINLP